jgi:hypothetical protein
MIVQPGLKSAFAALVLLLGAAAQAQSVYKSVDESGRIVYTDRPPAAKSDTSKVKPPPPVSNHAYESARLRAESDRVYSERLHWEDRSRRPIVVHDPQNLQRPPTPPRREPGVNVRRDPNLPDAPAPSTDRTYYYGGR